MVLQVIIAFDCAIFIIIIIIIMPLQCVNAVIGRLLIA
jgi:hypothetical protein